MTQQVINVGPAPNDGLGDPIRTAYTKCNNNFGELYARAQTTPPASLVGSAGDQAGMYAYDSNYFYYCYADYDGSSVIWAQISEIGNVSVSQIASGTSNVQIADINGDATISIDGTSNVAVFTSSGATVDGTLSVSGTVTGDIVVINSLSATGTVSAESFVANSSISGATLTGALTTNSQPNITSVGTLSSLSVTGNTAGGNLLTVGQVSATGNVTGNYLLGNGAFISGIPPAYSNANVDSYLPVYSGNISAGNISVTSNVTGGNINTAGKISSTGNISTQGVISATGNIVSDGYFVGNFTGNIVGTLTNIPGPGGAIVYNNGSGNAAAVAGLTYNDGSNTLIVLGVVSAQGNVIGGNVTTTGLVSATGNITGGNVLTSGLVSATGNITGGNVLSAGIVSSTSNITGGNVLTSGLVSATGNITGGNLNIGTGTVNAGQIVNGTSNIVVASSGNISMAVDSIPMVTITTTANAATTPCGIFVDGFIHARANGVNQSGNIIAGNVRTNGQISAVGNIIGGNLSTGIILGTSISGSGNITGGNILTGGLLTVTGNILSGGIVSATGNVTGGNITGGAVSVVANVTGGNVLSAGIVSSSGNITGGNVLTGGQVSATGNVTGNFILGNISQATGYFSSKIFNGTSEINIGSSSGNANITIGGTSNVAVISTSGLSVTGTTVATANITGGNLLTSGLISATGTVTGSSFIGSVAYTSGTVSGTGNITGGNLLTGGLVSAGGNVTGSNFSGSNITASGVITVNSSDNATAIVNGGSNAVGNIGSSSKYFNTLFATAATALYADLAENYTADAVYEPGTVVCFGGSAEVTKCDSDACVTVAGVVSTNPAYTMNAGLEGIKATVALMGRVPVKVKGPVTRGAMLVSAGNGHARAESAPAIGTVIGKALESFDGSEGVIEVVVGRL